MIGHFSTQTRQAGHSQVVLPSILISIKTSVDNQFGISNDVQYVRTFPESQGHNDWPV